MKKNFKYIELSYLLIFVICICSANFLHFKFKKKQIVIDKQESAINLKEDLLLLFSIGQNRLLSDLLWITTLLESDLKHYKKRDYNSWLYLRFLSIANLDPLFLRNYQFGGQYLSIIKDDLYGAKEIFERGLSYYPNDFDLNFNAAFLYAFELVEPKRAIELYENLIRLNKAPKYIISIVNKLKYEKTGNIELAYELVKESLNRIEHGSKVYAKLKKDLYSIKATIDLKCLNNQKENCDKLDANGNEYIKDLNGKYKAQEVFEEYKINRRKKGKP